MKERLISNLGPISSTRKSGNESFHVNGLPLPDKLLSFWQWSSSDLVGNSLRGILAEYIVASALGCVSDIRQEWDNYDIETQEGLKVEVKSGAYLQSWSQKKLSSIQFGIKPTNGWDFATNTWTGKKIRQSDVYVFCLLQHKDKNTVDPMNVAQWKFYILPTFVLNREVSEQATIALSSLKKLNPVSVEYSEIHDTIKHLMAR